MEVCSGIREDCDELGRQFRVSIDPVGFFCPTVESFTQKWEQDWILMVDSTLCLFDNETVRLVGTSLEDAVDRLVFSHAIGTPFLRT